MTEIEYPPGGFDWEFDLTEALRWCWRHNASLEFEFFPEDGDIYPTITLATPLRHPEGEVDRASKKCLSQTHTTEVVVDLVRSVRDRLLLE